MKIWKLAALWVPVIVAACNDVDANPTRVTNQLKQIASPDGPEKPASSLASQTPPAGVPPEFQHQTTVSVAADVGFIGQTGYGQALVKYGGTNGSATVDLVARNEQGANVGSNTGVTAESHFFPFEYSVTASTNLPLTAACGITLTATAKGEVFNSFLTSSQSTLTWGGQKASDTRSKAQAACPATPPNVCKSTARLAPRFDCTSPPTGGDGSQPPAPQTEPPTYTPPPYYSPKPGQYVCIVHYGGTDYEWRECWWVENNDTRLAAGSGARSDFAGFTSARASNNAGKLPSIFVVVSDQVPVGAMAVLDRHKQGPYKNVLLVPSANFRPAELVRAMRYVYASLAADGDTPPKEFTALLRGTVSDTDVSAAERDYAATFATMLGKAKNGDVGKYGVHPVLEIQLGDAKSK